MHYIDEAVIGKSVERTKSAQQFTYCTPCMMICTKQVAMTYVLAKLFN
jgi:hypothetical protein